MRHETLRALVLCLALHAWAETEASPVLPPAYLAAVKTYASGDRDGATAELAAWPEPRLRNLVRTVGSLAAEAAFCRQIDCPVAVHWSRFPVTAALMLHTDASLRASGNSVKLHEAAAYEYARLAHANPELRELAREWYTTMALRAQWNASWNEALAWAARGLEVDPNAPDLLLVVASVQEALASQESSPPTMDIFEVGSRNLRTSTALARGRREYLERARTAARSAVAAAPSRDDAGVRLGRIAWKLGDRTEARAALQAVVSRGAVGDAGYLAHLFLGRVDEDEGRYEDAVQSYAAAVSIGTKAQTARLALSHARLRMGDTTEARQELDSAIRLAGSRRPTDPFWVYPWGASAEAQARLDALRRRVGP